MSLALYLALLAIFVGGLLLPVFIGNLAAYIIATVFNYLANYLWAFGSTDSHLQAGTRFGTIVVIGVVANGVFVPQVASLGVPVELAAVAFAVVWPLISFSALNLWAFR